MILLLHFGFVFSYYSLKLNKISLPQLRNSTDSFDNITINNITEHEIEDLEEYIDLPLNNSEINQLNETYIKTKNIKSELYYIDSYIGSNNQYFRLLLSTFDNISTIASIDCISCNVSNKYNSSLSNNNINLFDINNGQNSNINLPYKMFMDSLLISSELRKDGIKEKNNITVDNFIFKVLESNTEQLIYQDLIDGIISLSYNDNSQIPNSNFIMGLYNEGKISSPSFSIIITSSNVNRLYLGDIMKNDYIKNIRILQ